MPASAMRFEYVEDRADLYEKHASNEAWGVDHEWVMLCFDYAELVSEGIDLYDSICQLDNDWRLGVLEGKYEYKIDFERRIEELFGKWLATSEKSVALYSMIENEYQDRGFEIEPVEKLKAVCREILGSKVDDKVFFAHDKTFEMADNAVQENSRGLIEDMDSLV